MEKKTYPYLLFDLDNTLFDFNAGEYEPAIGSHITAFINGNKSVAIKVK